MIIKPLTGFISKSQELLALLGIAWGLGVGVTAQKLGFSLEVGALFAGILLASMSYAQEISSRLRPLRDFFIVVFFIALGAKLNLADMGAVVWQALLLSIFVLVGNPLIVIAIMGLLGYTKKTSFKAGLAVAQISEFSLIFILLGFRNGQVSGQAVSLVTLVGIITIAVSSYMIIYSDGLFHLIEKYLYLFERRKVKIEHDKTRYFDAVLFGYKRGGHEYVKMFPTISKNFGVIDYDPDVIDDMERKNIPYIYGDATDIELIEEIGLDRSRLIIVNITDHDTNVSLLTTLEKINHKAVIICHADNVHEAAELYGLGATYVILPAYIGSEKISNFIKKSGLKKSEFKQYREKHLEYLQTHYLLDGDE